MVSEFKARDLRRDEEALTDGIPPTPKSCVETSVSNVTFRLPKASIDLMTMVAADVDATHECDGPDLRGANTPEAMISSRPIQPPRHDSVCTNGGGCG
eukprot:m.702390 g.702390  ORF g.702390 m.702390 type:complete len:98 (-) comp22915_c0_seq11:1250-1543(-)